MLAAKAAKPAVKPKAKATTPVPGSMNSPPLTAVIAKILGESTQPIPARELGNRVLATGYQTKSKDFTNLIWTGVGKMANVENVPGQGYRLKKGKGSK